MLMLVIECQSQSQRGSHRLLAGKKRNQESLLQKYLQKYFLLLQLILNAVICQPSDSNIVFKV